MPERGLLDGVLARFAGATRRIRSRLFWRLLYATMASRAGVTALRVVFRIVARLRGEAAVGGVQERMFHTLVRSGWPHHGPGWHNLDAARLLTRASRPGRRVTRPARQPVAAPRRVGAVGRFNRLFGFPPELFSAAPPELEVHVFDIPWYADRAAPFLADLVGEYTQCPIETETWDRDVDRLASAVEAANLDLLLVIGEKADVYDLLDRVAPPAVAYVAQGADLLYHQNVSFHLFAEQVADYTIVDRRLLCRTSESWFGDQVVFPARIFYDNRGIDPKRRRSWAEREPLLIFHGGLYKALGHEYLDTLFRLLQEDDSLQLILMGRDWDGRREGGALEAIHRRAAESGVGSRVQYDGAFSGSRNLETGVLDEPGWLRLVDHLARARLAPNPWPLGGASARVEAYLSGTPAPHLGVRDDPESWRKPQHALVDVPALRVPTTTVKTPEEYFELAQRLLSDGSFADSVAAEQVEIAERVTDARAYWRQLLDCYDAWLTSAASIGRRASRR